MQIRDSRSQAAVTDPRDYFAHPAQLVELGKFGQRLFTALGCTVESSVPGFDFEGLCNFYSDHMLQAWKCINQEDQLKWIEEAADSFRSALAALGASLQQRIYSSDPANVVLPRVLIPVASEQIQACRNKQTSLNTLAEFRVNYESIMPQSGTPLDSYELPLPSQRPKAKTVSKAKPAGKHPPLTKAVKQEPTSEEASKQLRAQPGVRADSHRWGNGHNLLFISGQVWNIKGIADRFKLDAKAFCWPFLLAACADHNRAARCDQWGKPGHKSLRDKAHVLPKGVTMSALKEFSRSATPPKRETASAHRDPPKAPRKLRGKGTVKRAKVSGGQSSIPDLFELDAAENSAEDGTGEDNAVGRTSVSGIKPSNGRPAPQ